jgi:acetyl esterase/lipase
LASRHSYGEHPSQFCELHAGGGDVAVLVHGGFWRARYGLDLERDLAADLVARGWTVWNVEYRRLGDGGGWPETGDDVVTAIAALPVDARRVVAIGHSAGGHLATWAAAHVRLDAVVAQAGALDL